MRRLLRWFGGLFRKPSPPDVGPPYWGDYVRLGGLVHRPLDTARECPFTPHRGVPWQVLVATDRSWVERLLGENGPRMRVGTRKAIEGFLRRPA